MTGADSDSSQTDGNNDYYQTDGNSQTDNSNSNRTDESDRIDAELAFRTQVMYCILNPIVLLE